MNLIQTAFKALDFRIFDRQGHELTLWHHNDDQETPTHELAAECNEHHQAAEPETQSQST